jgi:hypothetical protein
MINTRPPPKLGPHLLPSFYSIAETILVLWWGLYRSHEISVCRVVTAHVSLDFPWHIIQFCRTIMSAADLASMPAATPPPGVTANFDNPPSNAYILIIVTTICMVLLYVTMAISLYAKLNIRKKVALDDCEIIALFQLRGHANLFRDSINCDIWYNNLLYR